MHDELVLVVAFGGTTEDATVLLVGVLHVLEAPRRPQAIHLTTATASSCGSDRARSVEILATAVVAPCSGDNRADRLARNSHRHDRGGTLKLAWMMFANHAEIAPNGLLYISGGAWDTI